MFCCTDQFFKMFFVSPTYQCCTVYKILQYIPVGGLPVYPQRILCRFLLIQFGAECLSELHTLRRVNLPENILHTDEVSTAASIDTFQKKVEWGS